MTKKFLIASVIASVFLCNQSALAKPVYPWHLPTRINTYSNEPKFVTGSRYYAPGETEAIWYFEYTKKGFRYSAIADCNSYVIQYSTNVGAKHLATNLVKTQAEKVMYKQVCIEDLD